MADDKLEESTEWMFPAIDIWSSEENEAENDGQDFETVAEDVEEAPVNEEELESDRIFSEKMAHLEDLKNDLLNKISILNKIFEELKNSPISIDEEMIALIERVVKKSVKKIIQKEMQNDDKILPQMIGHLKSLIEEKSSVLNIYISHDDYQKIMEGNLLPNNSLTINPSLQSGDIIVKSNFTEISAILDERIESLTKVDHA
ncbi:MAG: FliH/SctL family protein [Gammaproteobacteria bacterium]